MGRIIWPKTNKLLLFINVVGDCISSLSWGILVKYLILLLFMYTCSSIRVVSWEEVVKCDYYNWIELVWFWVYRLDKFIANSYDFVCIRHTRWICTSGSPGLTGVSPTRPAKLHWHWVFPCWNGFGSRTRTFTTGNKATCTPLPLPTSLSGCTRTGGCSTPVDWR